MAAETSGNKLTLTSLGKSLPLVGKTALSGRHADSNQI